MLLYKDILSGDEMFSDAFEPKLVDDVVYEVDCAMVTIKEGDIDIGANPSAEDQEEALDNTANSVNNLISSFALQRTVFDKKGYLSHLKEYMKAIKIKIQESDPDHVADFEKGAQAYARKIVANLENYEFYTGESMNPDGMVALLNYREDGTTPYFTFWKDGVKNEKV